MALPKGYVALKKEGKILTVGVTDFLLMTQDAEPLVELDGVRYQRGPLTVIPSNLAGKVCSCREYEEVESA